MPNAGPKSCGHAEGNVQTLTGLAPGANGNTAYAAGPSADTIIAKALGSGDPLALTPAARASSPSASRSRRRELGKCARPT